MPKLIDHDRRREEIAEATWRVIHAEGISGVSIRTVAAEAGISTGSIRHVFPSKTELLVHATELVGRRAPGRIVCVASVSGLVGNRGQVNYSASKAGLIGAAKALAIELARRRITVNCVAPGLIETEMIDERVPVDEILKAIPMQRMGQADEVAHAVAFLLSERAAYITRQVLAVNGGLC